MARQHQQQEHLGSGRCEGRVPGAACCVCACVRVCLCVRVSMTFEASHCGVVVLEGAREEAGMGVVMVMECYMSHVKRACWQQRRRRRRGACMEVHGEGDKAWCSCPVKEKIHVCMQQLAAVRPGQ